MNEDTYNDFFINLQLRGHADRIEALEKIVLKTSE